MTPRLSHADSAPICAPPGAPPSARPRPRLRPAVAGRDDVVTRARAAEKFKELPARITENAHYVGRRFPEEARKMHYGETEHRSIYGEASPEGQGIARGGHRISPPSGASRRSELGYAAADVTPPWPEACSIRQYQKHDTGNHQHHADRLRALRCAVQTWNVRQAGRKRAASTTERSSGTLAAVASAKARNRKYKPVAPRP